MEEIPIGKLLANMRKQQKDMESKMLELVDHVSNSNHSHTWKKEGLKKQYKIATSVSIKLTAAKAALAS